MCYIFYICVLYILYKTYIPMKLTNIPNKEEEWGN